MRATTMALRSLPRPRLARALSTRRPPLAIPGHGVLVDRESCVAALKPHDLLILAESGSVNACREQMRREIMRVDGVAYVGTSQQLLTMNDFVDRKVETLTMPYVAAIWCAYVAGWASLPLVFSYDISQAFNDAFVTADPPAHGEYDTMLEVGAWSWTWMEPLTGAPAFSLLCLQFARDARQSIGGTTASERMRAFEGARLSEAFPMYCPRIVGMYGRAVAMRPVDEAHALVAEHERICKAELEAAAHEQADAVSVRGTP